MSPHALSAAMKVDSAFVSSLLPALQCSLSASLLQVRLANHVSCLGQGLFGLASQHTGSFHGHGARVRAQEERPEDLIPLEAFSV